MTHPASSQTCAPHLLLHTPSTHTNTISPLQTRVFGLHLVQLDIRQESVKHTEAMDTITTYLGLGSYK